MVTKSIWCCEYKSIEIIDLQEKPIIKNYINAGVYVLEP